MHEKRWGDNSSQQKHETKLSCQRRLSGTRRLQLCDICKHKSLGSLGPSFPCQRWRRADGREASAWPEEGEGVWVARRRWGGRGRSACERPESSTRLGRGRTRTVTSESPSRLPMTSRPHDLTLCKLMTCSVGKQKRENERERHTHHAFRQANTHPQSYLDE